MRRQDPLARDEGPRPLSDSLERVAGRLGVADGRGLARLYARWAEIVGPAMADHVTPVRIDSDVLVVKVDHPAWATQVRHLGEGLLDRVHEVSGLARPSRLELRVRR